MAHYIQIEFPTDDLRPLDLGGQNRFALHVGPSKKISKRIDDATSTTSDDRFRILAKR
jgi:hypothetical protein